jgi:hypothetical protein
MNQDFPIYQEMTGAEELKLNQEREMENYNLLITQEQNQKKIDNFDSQRK